MIYSFSFFKHSFKFKCFLFLKEIDPLGSGGCKKTQTRLKFLFLNIKEIKTVQAETVSKKILIDPHFLFSLPVKLYVVIYNKSDYL